MESIRIMEEILGMQIGLTTALVSFLKLYFVLNLFANNNINWF
jgi:hypothetical protein